MFIGYLQKTDSVEKNQHCHDELLRAGCESIIETAVNDQTSLQENLFTKLKQDDTLVIWKLD